MLRLLPSALCRYGVRIFWVIVRGEPLVQWQEQGNGGRECVDKVRALFFTQTCQEMSTMSRYSAFEYTNLTMTMPFSPIWIEACAAYSRSGQTLTCLYNKEAPAVSEQGESEGLRLCDW